MNTKLIGTMEKTYLRKDLPNFKVGDTIAVHTIIREGDKQRIQVFKGLVIRIKGSGTRKTFTVRKISYGIGVEKIFPWNSPNIAKIEILKHGSVRRAKLYYLRNRVGKLALKVKPGKPALVIEHGEEAQDVLEEKGEIELSDSLEEEAEVVEEVEKNEPQEKGEEAKND